MNSRRLIVTLLILLLLALGLAGACSGPQSSGESHFGVTKAFLRICDDGVCESGDSCECAVCTVSCGSVADCAERILGAGESADDLPDNVVCQVPQCIAEQQDGDSSGGDSLCDVLCESDADCAFLGDDDSVFGHVCRDGACRTVDDPVNPDAGEVSAPISCPVGSELVPAAATQDGFAFCLNLTEVTVSDYRDCVDAGDCEAPTAGNYLTVGHDEHPIHQLSSDQAADYCEFAGGRLPTLDEFVAASAGDFPWGDTAPASDDMPARVCAFGTDTCEVSSFAEGEGPQGYADLSGNVAEWVQGSSGICAAGGSYESTMASELEVGSCVDTTAPALTIGFRCAKSP